MLPGPADAATRRSSTTPTAPTYDLSSLRLAVTGAARDPGRADPAHARRAHLRDDHHRLRAHRGRAASRRCAATTTTPRPSPPRRGRAIPGVEVRVVDDDGAEVPRGEPGEIVVRGYNVMRGYFDDPEETADGRSTPTAGCTPATSASWTSAATCASPTARRTCSSSAGSTRTRPRSRT